jgi:hypothetical protein
MSIHKPRTDIVNKEKFDYLSSSRSIQSWIELDDKAEYFLITYNPEISEEVCSESKIDYFDVLNREGNIDLETNTKFGFVSVATAAAITSYARIYINSVKL